MSYASTARHRDVDRSLAAIEARRFARHPLFLVGAVIAWVMAWMAPAQGEYPTELLAYLIAPAFFIGVPSIVVAHRLTRSSERSAEAMATVPSSEADHTRALVGACVVPFAAGLVWTAIFLASVAVNGPVHPNEPWFGTMNDLDVASILLALGPVACLGGGLLGVLFGRWLKFPGAGVVVAVAVILVDLAGQGALANSSGDTQRLRLWVPWAMFDLGSNEDGTQSILAGSPVFYLAYLLALCGLAATAAIWHDRTARGGRTTAALAGFAGAAVLFLALAMLTGPDAFTSGSVPSLVEK